MRNTELTHKINNTELNNRLKKLLSLSSRWIMSNECSFLIKDKYEVKSIDKKKLCNGGYYNGRFSHSVPVSLGSYWVNQVNTIELSHQFGFHYIGNHISLKLKKKINKLYKLFIKYESNLTFKIIRKFIRFLITSFNWLTLNSEKNPNIETNDNKRNLLYGQFSYYTYECRILDIVNTPYESSDRELKFSKMLGGLDVRWISQLRYT